MPEAWALSRTLPRTRRSDEIGRRESEGGTVDKLKSIVLRDQNDADGVRYLGAEWRDDGGIVIEGQDLGPGSSAPSARAIPNTSGPGRSSPMPSTRWLPPSEEVG